MMKSEAWAAGLGLWAMAVGMPLAARPPIDIHGTAFDVCYQQGCAEHMAVQLSQTEAESILESFALPAATAAQERASIALAISRFEQIVGPRTGTDRDLGGTFPGAFRAGQMDCIDESTNTTTYLRLLEKAGVLRWHDILKPATRLPIPRGWWPHTSAVLRERASNTKYAVDSWFEDNGAVPHIVELKLWRRGWKPGSPTRHETQR